MRLAKFLLFGMITFLSHPAVSQSENQDCERLKFLAGEAISVGDYNSAVSYLIKGEISCGGYDLGYWERLLGCLKVVINEEVNDQDRKWLYRDTLLNGWDRQELAGLYDETSDLERGMYIMMSSTPDAAKADQFFQRGIKAQGAKTHEAYLVYAYYTTYLIYHNAEGNKKAEFKQRMISDYLFYLDLIDTVGISPMTRESLDTYYDYAFLSCYDLLPEVQEYLESLPKDTVAAIHSIQRMTQLLEDECSRGEEYKNLIDEWLKLDSNSIEANYKKDQTLIAEDPILWIGTEIDRTNNPELKSELQYKKAYIQYKSGQYQAAYSSGKACTGEYKSKGFLIAAQCVATLANSCGDTTFERKCNFIYAAQLAEEAGQTETAAKYRSAGPLPMDCTGEDKTLSVYLSCWDLTVYPCR